MTWGKKRALVIFLVVLFFVLFVVMVRPPERLPSKSVLVLELNGAIEEQRPVDLFTALWGRTIPVVHDYLDAIDTAKNDARITGLVVKVGPLATGWGKLEEIRSHLLAFRQSGKPSICYLGYDGIGNREYYLATACEKLWLVPTSELGVRGMMASALFLRGTLDKLKIYPDMYHIAEYKTASNMFTEKKFTPAHREEIETLLHGIYNQYLTDVSETRHFDRSQFESLVQQGPFLAKEALADKLVDQLAYWDEIQDFFRKKDGDWKPVDLGGYRKEVPNAGTERIAVVHATGTIVSGQSDNSPSGGFIMGGDSVSADLRRAREDSSIKAIVLRVDSGGGSSVASEVIRREVELAHKQKPVVVSMSDVAASGGYWISMSADKIVADPNTITASIGVISGKLNISGLYHLLGLSTDYVATSDNATMYWDQQNFTPAQRESLQKSLQDIYASFIQGVAASRKMSVEAVDKIGKGRVWTGAQAKDLGLVDELGGVDRAITVAKQLARIRAGAAVQVVQFPEEKTFFQLLFEKERSRGIEGGTPEARLEVMLRRLMGVAEPVEARIPFELTIR
jgi:protease-4